MNFFQNKKYLLIYILKIKLFSNKKNLLAQINKKNIY